MEPTRYTDPPAPDVTPEPGVYTFGLDEDRRRALNFAPGLMSYSKLRRHDDPDKKISKYVAGVGNMVSDVLLFGYEACAARYYYHDEQVKYNTKEGKAVKAQLEADHPGMTIMRPKETAEANALIETALANDEIKRALNSPGYSEAGLVADIDGVRFRSWVDKLLPRAIIDIKTSRAANEGEFLDTVSKYGYDGQGALYMDQAEALGLGQLGYAWFVISKTSNRAWVQQMPPWAYWTGKRWIASMVRSHRRETMLKGTLQDVLGENMVGDKNA